MNFFMYNNNEMRHKVSLHFIKGLIVVDLISILVRALFRIDKWSSQSGGKSPGNPRAPAAENDPLTCKVLVKVPPLGERRLFRDFSEERMPRRVAVGPPEKPNGKSCQEPSERKFRFIFICRALGKVERGEKASTDSAVEFG